MRTCQSCGLQNPPDRDFCECGDTFVGSPGLCPGDHAGDGCPGRGGGCSSGARQPRRRRGRSPPARSGGSRASAAARPARPRGQPARPDPALLPRMAPSRGGSGLTIGDPIGRTATGPAPAPRAAARPAGAQDRRSTWAVPIPPRAAGSPSRGAAGARPGADHAAPPRPRRRQRAHARALGGAGPARPRDGAGAQPGLDHRQLPAARGGCRPAGTRSTRTRSTSSRSARAAPTSRRWRSTSTRRARGGRGQAVGAAGRRALQGAGAHGRGGAGGAGDRALHGDGLDGCAPQRVKGRRKAHYDVAVENKANAPVLVALEGRGPGRRAGLRLQPAARDPAGQDGRERDAGAPAEADLDRPRDRAPLRSR